MIPFCFSSFFTPVKPILSNLSIVRIADEFVIDLMKKACGIDYEEASKDVVYKEIEGVKIPIPTEELLIRMKDTVRPSDKADTNFLRASVKRRNSK